jgi:WD40 repeat protein
VQTGEVKEEKELHEKQINDIKMSPDGTHFITASSDKTAKLVDTQTLEVSSLSRHRGSCHMNKLSGKLWMALLNL